MTILLIDASNMAYRARFSYDLTHQGKDVSITYGVLRMMMALVKSQRPSGIIMCFDGGHPNYRKALIPRYKADRKHEEDPTHVEYIRQVAELWRMLPYFGLMCVRRDGIEADDLMFHASRMSVEPSVIVTNDDDLLQAVNESTSVLKPGSMKYKERMIDLSNFRAETGVDAEWYLMAKTILGDSSDRVPGCNGIGPVKVSKMFERGYPDSDVLNDKLKKSLQEFFDCGQFDRSCSCMRLDLDLCGARRALLDASWVPYNNKIAYKYCLDNAFVSLIEAGSIGQTFGQLQRPELQRGNFRVPRIWSTDRRPLELN